MGSLNHVRVWRVSSRNTGIAGLHCTHWCNVTLICKPIVVRNLNMVNIHICIYPDWLIAWKRKCINGWVFHSFSFTDLLTINIFVVFYIDHQTQYIWLLIIKSNDIKLHNSQEWKHAFDKRQYFLKSTVHIVIINLSIRPNSIHICHQCPFGSGKEICLILTVTNMWLKDTES